MMTSQHGGMTPREQEQCLNNLVSRLPAADRAAMLEVAEWIATERPPDHLVTPAQVVKWIGDVRGRYQAPDVRPTAVVLQFRRTQ